MKCKHFAIVFTPFILEVAVALFADMYELVSLRFSDHETFLSFKRSKALVISFLLSRPHIIKVTSLALLSSLEVTRPVPESITNKDKALSPWGRAKMI